MPDLSLRREQRRRPPASWVEKGPHPMAARVKEDIVRRRRARSRVSSPGGTYVRGPVPGGVRGGRPVPPSGARGGRPCAPAASTEEGLRRRPERGRKEGGDGCRGARCGRGKRRRSEGGRKVAAAAGGRKEAAGVREAGRRAAAVSGEKARGTEGGWSEGACG